MRIILIDYPIVPKLEKIGVFFRIANPSMDVWWIRIYSISQSSSFKPRGSVQIGTISGNLEKIVQCAWGTDSDKTEMCFASSVLILGEQLVISKICC